MKNIIRISKFRPIVLLFYFFNVLFLTGQIRSLEIIVPLSHTAISDDLEIKINSSTFLPLVVQLSRLESNSFRLLATFPVYPELEGDVSNRNLTTVKLQCGYFTKAGQYYLQIQKQTAPILGGNNTSSETEIITKIIDVRWPLPQLTVSSQNIMTYPQHEVFADLSFPGAKCSQIIADLPQEELPEYWLELHYCCKSLKNHTTADNGTENLNRQILYSEKVTNLPKEKVFTLRCELFGIPGYYYLLLRPTKPDPLVSTAEVYIKVDWSDQYVFNVKAEAIFPCETHGGIQVVLHYPSCILTNGDRVRLYAKLRANVASLAAPTTMEYISEQKVLRNKHTLVFNCDLFTERYVEYCFVYVSQSIFGAIEAVRQNCIPTLPVIAAEEGGWSEWSEWTPCTSTCVGGIKSRYRLCNSPFPKYGGKFCMGPAVERQKCGNTLGQSMECIYNGALISNNIVPLEIPEIKAEVGTNCKCGCILHLDKIKSRRFLATSSQSCPGRNFWYIQAEEDSIIQFRVEQFRIPCGTQWLRIRDGKTISSSLLSDLDGEPDSIPQIVNTTGPNLLLEYYSDEKAIAGEFCDGGFLAEAIQITLINLNITEVQVAHSIRTVIPLAVLKTTAVHIAALFFLSGLVIATFFLGIQYAFRYRKYQVAELDDQDSLAASTLNIPLKTRTQSNSTLLSEVISLTRIRPLNMKGRTNKHVRLRESMDCDKELFSEEIALAKVAPTPKGSTTTLTSANNIVDEDKIQKTPTLAHPESVDITPINSVPTSPRGEWKIITRSSTLSEKDQSNEKDIVVTSSSSGHQSRRNSNATLTNVSDGEMCSKSDPGFYSSIASMVSTATIRSTNAKATKDKRNRAKLLAGPDGGSDISIAGPDSDLEIDYYDYNVVNAGAAPGSYLGMDPAFLVWIPPLDETGEILPQENVVEASTNIRPKVYVDPGSNKESPEEETLLPKIRRRSLSESTSINSPSVVRKKSKKTYALVHGQIDNKYLNETQQLLNNKKVSIQMHEIPKKFRPLSPQNMEKETKVEKSPSLTENIGLDEIRFADDDNEEVERKVSIEEKS